MASFFQVSKQKSTNSELRPEEIAERHPTAVEKISLES